jgi:hypothetical protein
MIGNREPVEKSGYRTKYGPTDAKPVPQDALDDDWVVIDQPKGTASVDASHATETPTEDSKKSGDAARYEWEELAPKEWADLLLRLIPHPC